MRQQRLYTKRYSARSLRSSKNTKRVSRFNPKQNARRYTQVSTRHRRSGMDAGTQAQGCETIGWHGVDQAHAISELPSMALDTGIHAGMTTLKHTCV